MRATVFVFFSLIVVCARAQQDTLVCEKEYSDINSWNYKGILRKEATGTFSLKQGDSVRYIILREKKRRAVFSIVDSNGNKVVTRNVDKLIISGKMEPVNDVTYFFHVKSKSLLPNSFIVTVKKRNCAYQKKAKPEVIPVIFTTDTTDAAILSTRILLASKLNMKNKQRFSLPVDSLIVPVDSVDSRSWRSELKFTIKSQGGPVTYAFEDTYLKIVKNGKGMDEKGSIPVTGLQKSYSLVVENEDMVAGKHVEINVRQLVYRRVPQKSK